MKRKKVVIIGAGPAGLAAGYEFLKKGGLEKFDVEIFDADCQVGGISKTLRYKGYRFDVGGHRLYTKFPEIQEFYKKILGRDFLTRSLPKRIFYQQKYFEYPLSPVNALTNLGVLMALKVGASWGKRQIRPFKNPKTFEEWVTNRFGDDLYRMFFKSYSEKIWGIPMTELSADWAAQRIQNFDLLKAVINAFTKKANAKTVITSFNYPRYGSGQLYENIQKILTKSGIKVSLNTQVVGIESKNNKISAIKIKNTKNGKSAIIKADYFVSTMPFNQLTRFLNPPKTLLNRLGKIYFRNFITVNLIIKGNPNPFQCIYVHEPNVDVGRIENFRNWSLGMVPKRSQNAPLCMEYFTFEHERLWKKSDSELLKQAKEEINRMGIVPRKNILGGFVHRAKDVYPVYNFDYATPLEMAKKHVGKYTNLYTCGRGGLFKYNNMDHSILTGFYAARNIIENTRKHDVWSVNDEDEYVESSRGSQA